MRASRWKRIRTVRPALSTTGCRQPYLAYTMAECSSSAAGVGAARTLLDMMLGQVSNVVSAGELREIWLRGCVENRPCGCGAPFWDCWFWRDVGKHAFGGWDQLDLLSILQTRYALDRPRGMPAVLLRPATARGSAAMEGGFIWSKQRS
jgi:hypothetical protein